MRQTLSTRVTAFLIALAIAAPALAQSTMIRGKVIDAKKEGIPNVQIIIESLGGSGRKLTTKTDRKGEFNCSPSRARIASPRAIRRLDPPATTRRSCSARRRR